MSRNKSEIYRFGTFSLDAAERNLRDGEKAVQLAPKIFDTLLMLVENAGRVVSKEKMLAEIWDDSFVEENNLAQNISVLRRVLGEKTTEKIIETVPKFGYRFVAPVERSTDVLAAETEVFERTRARVYVSDGEAIDVFARADGLPGIDSAQRTAAIPDTRYVQNGDVN